MHLNNAIYAILSIDPDLIAMTGNRIYPVIAKQATAYPIVIFSVLNINPFPTKSGVSQVDQYRVQFTAYSANLDQAHNTDTAIRAALDRYPHLTVAGIHLDGIDFLTTENGFEMEKKVSWVSSDYHIRVKRTEASHATVTECLDLSSFNFTLAAGDTVIDVGFLATGGYLLFGGYIGALIPGVDFTASGNEITITQAPFTDDVAFTLVRNRVRVRLYEMPAGEDTLLIGGILNYSVLVFVGDAIQVAVTDYTISNESITFIDPDPSGFTFKIVANACSLLS